MANTQEPISHNFFADEEAYLWRTGSVTPQYTSAILPKEVVAPNLRRRGSSSDANGGKPNHNRHLRSSTETYIPNYGGSASGGHHPLRSAGLSPGSSDAGVTRPHLSRMVNVGALVDVPPVDFTEVDGQGKEEEKDVLVHEVTCKDSLAGVSLKYGIPLAELRKANQLWASDRIHLRKVLYIPLDKATRAKELTADSKLISITPPADSEDSDPFDLYTGTSNGRLDSPETSPASFSPFTGTGTIRRIPASQLSFFPPSNLSKTPRTTTGTLSTPSSSSPYSTSKSYQSHTRYASSPSHSLTSILTALPIAASTRDTIIARLSFDSASSSYNDRERDDERHEGHELDDVKYAELFPRATSSTGRHQRHPDGDNAFVQTPVSTTTPRSTRQIPRVQSGSALPQAPSSSRAPGMQRLASSPPNSYVPVQTHVRTVQMEPSPEMRLPHTRLGNSLTQGKSKRKTRALIDLDFELEGRNGGVGI